MGCAWSAEAGRRLAGSGGRGASLRTFLSAKVQEAMDCPDSTPVYPRWNGGLGRTVRSLYHYCNTGPAPEELRTAARGVDAAPVARPTGRRSGLFSMLVWRRRPDLNRRMEVLQTSALPLGYGALSGRTTKPRVSGREKVERETGFEPATSTLARSHSTTELFPLQPSSYVSTGPAQPTQGDADLERVSSPPPRSGSLPARHRTVTTSNRHRHP